MVPTIAGRRKPENLSNARLWFRASGAVRLVDRLATQVFEKLSINLMSDVGIGSVLRTGQTVWDAGKAYGGARGAADHAGGA